MILEIQCSCGQLKMSTARPFVFQLFLLVAGRLYAKPQYYTLDTGDCQRNGKLLEDIAANNTNDSEQDVFIILKIPCINVNNNITFRQLHSLTIQDDPNPPTVITCTQVDSSAGITVNHVSNVMLHNLILIYCGKVQKLDGMLYSSAMTILHCNNVSIINLLFTKSKGTGLIIFQHLEGRVHILASNFTVNKPTSKLKKYIFSGGGAYIQGSFSTSSSVSFEFEQCIFANNVAHTSRYYSFYTDEFGESRTGYGRGGGAYIHFRQNRASSDITVSFTRCKFIKNLAFLGGGLAVNIGGGRHTKISPKILVTVKDTVFISNGCSCEKDTETILGGGANLDFNAVMTNGGEYSFQNVIFTSNCAEFGGGVFFFSVKQSSSHCTLVFDDCKFERNRAHTGSAIDLTPNIFMRLSTVNTNITPLFRNCTFTKNVVVNVANSRGTQMIAGVGTIYASLYDIRLEGKNHFENNDGTPVYMVNGAANFANSDVTFKCNKGTRGGAIALIGASLMIVGPNREYLFMNNVARYQGGAIFTLMIDSHDFTISKTCFIQYIDKHRSPSTDWNTNITFIGNDATFGKAIFTTSLHACQTIKENDTFTFTTTTEVFSRRGINIRDEDITTEGAHLYHIMNKLYVIPGKQYNHTVEIFDDLNKIVNESLRIETNSEEVKLDPVFTSFTGKTLQLKGSPGQEANITLQTVSNRESYTTLEVHLEECPPGFVLETDRCVCKVNEYFGLIDYCDYDRFQAYLTPGLWAGLIKGNEFVTSTCPYSFCDYKVKDNDTSALGIMLPQNVHDLDDVVCGVTRTGILCGTCRGQHTVYFHSPKFTCYQINQTLCEVGWLFYILSELVPVTAVFITVIVFNISFTSGAVNGFIIFSQILLSLNIDASGVIRFPNKKQVTEGYQFLYGFLNLDFFATDTLSFCLWPNATALDIIAFKYITIVYALSLVILAIWIMNKCGGRCRCRITKVKSSIIHGLSAFLIICYSQSITVSHRLLNGAELWPKNGSNTTISKRVWLDGNMTYFSQSHLPYALPALTCLLTIGILPPILLLAYPLCNKALTVFGLEESKLVTCISQKLPVSSLKPLLDCFQSCFKDNLRFFAGLYILYRWVAPLAYSTSSDLGTAYTMTEIVLILMLALHALFQPYQKRVHNVVDTLLFTNLLLINSSTCINYYLFQSQESRDTVMEKVAITAAVQMILIYLPLVIMLLYLLVIGSKSIYLLWGRRNGCRASINDETDLPGTQMMRRVRAAVRLLGSVKGDIDDHDLPHRLIAGEVSYECFEDVDCAQETYGIADTKSASASAVDTY